MTGIKFERIKKSREFNFIYRRGKFVVSRSVVLYYYPNRLQAHRLGFSISKKTGNSVQRHRIKRRFKEALRSLQGELKPGYDIVIVARKPAVNVKYREAREELWLACRKAKLI